MIDRRGCRIIYKGSQEGNNLDDDIYLEIKMEELPSRKQKFLFIISHVLSQIDHY
jgi:hypothetical protein